MERQQNQNQSQAVPEKAKTFTERFLEMEKRLIELENVVQGFEQNLNSLMPILSHITMTNRLLNEQLQAMYDLAELKKPLTRSEVIKMANQKRVDQVRSMIDTDLREGLIKPIETVGKADDIIVYKAKDVLLAFQTAQAFESQGISLSNLIGKKAGDFINDIEIVEIYEVVPKEINSENASTKE